MSIERLRGLNSEKETQLLAESRERGLVHFIDWDSLTASYKLLDEQIGNAKVSDVRVELNPDEIVEQVTAGKLDSPKLNNFWTHFYPNSLFWATYIKEAGSLPDYLVRFMKINPEQFQTTSELVIASHHFSPLEDEELSQLKVKYLWDSFNEMKSLVSKYDDVIGGVHPGVLVT